MQIKHDDHFTFINPCCLFTSFYRCNGWPNMTRVVIVICYKTYKTEFNAIFNRVFDSNSFKMPNKCKLMKFIAKNLVSLDFEKVHFIN